MATGYDEKEVLTSVIEILKEHLGDKFTGDLNRETSLESIDIESIHMVEIVFNIEDKYDINVPLESVGGVNTVGDLCDQLAELIKSSQQA